MSSPCAAGAPSTYLHLEPFMLYFWDCAIVGIVGVDHLTDLFFNGSLCLYCDAHHTVFYSILWTTTLMEIAS